MSDRPICENCRYWIHYQDDDTDGFGACRKYAPHPLIWHSRKFDSPAHQPESLWPLTHQWAWCGEWQEAQP